jgi:hypothetical protein
MRSLRRSARPRRLLDQLAGPADRRILRLREECHDGTTASTIINFRRRCRSATYSDNSLTSRLRSVASPWLRRPADATTARRDRRSQLQTPLRQRGTTRSHANRCSGRRGLRCPSRRRDCGVRQMPRRHDEIDDLNFRRRCGIARGYANRCSGRRGLRYPSRRRGCGVRQMPRRHDEIDDLSFRGRCWNGDHADSSLPAGSNGAAGRSSIQRSPGAL